MERSSRYGPKLNEVISQKRWVSSPTYFLILLVNVLMPVTKFCAFIVFYLKFFKINAYYAQIHLLSLFIGGGGGCGMEKNDLSE